MAKRKIHPKELRLVVATEDTKHQGRRMKTGARMHIARATVNSKLIRCCDNYHYPPAPIVSHYCTYPFGFWLLSNTPRVCLACLKTARNSVKDGTTQQPDWDTVFRLFHVR